MSGREERLEGALPIADPGHAKGTDNGSHDPVDSAPGDVPGVPGSDAAAGDGAEDSGWMCHFESATAVESLQPALSGWVATAWNQFALQRDLKIMDQGTGDGVSAGAWALDERLPAALWFQPNRSVGTGAEFLLIGSTIAVASDPETPIEVSDSWWQRGFADQVVSWCEQPEASALHNRVFAFGQPVRPLGPRYQPDECFPDLPGVAISRVLIVEDGRKMLVVPFAGDPKWVDNGPGSRSLTFIYKIEAAHQYEQLESSWSHAIDSLVRIQRLLTHPGSDLDGRRDPVLAAPLEVFLRGSGISAAGSVAARLRDALEDPDLPRKAQVMSQVWVVTNNEPGWESFRRIGQVGLRSAFRYVHTNPDLLTGEQLGSISYVYRDLCLGLDVDADYPWASFDDILTTVNARSSTPLPRQCTDCGAEASNTDQFCGSCGQALEADGRR